MPVRGRVRREENDGCEEKISFYGSTVEDAQEKCRNHLMLSSLHMKSKRVAWEATLDQEVHTYEEDTDDEPANMGEENESSRKRPRFAIGGVDEAAADLTSSSVKSRSLRAAKDNIADAEQAARKAQEIAMNVALAFGDVAAKLSQAYQRLDAIG